MSRFFASLRKAFLLRKQLGPVECSIGPNVLFEGYLNAEDLLFSSVLSLRNEEPGLSAGALFGRVGVADDVAHRCGCLAGVEAAGNNAIHA